MEKALPLTLATKEESFTNRNVVLLGSGGAASTIALKAAKEGAKKITILALQQKEAEGILEKAETLSNGIAVNYSLFKTRKLIKIV